MSTINERVALLRKELGLTQDEFGERIGIKKSAVSKLENGTNNVTDGTYKLILRAFNVSPLWLELGEGPMFEEILTDERVEQVFSKSDPFTITWMKALARLSDDDWEYFKSQLMKVEAIRKNR